MNRYIQMLVTMAIALLVFSAEARAADVSYLSGGVGADSRDELLAKEKEYNLKIVAAEKSGDYLAGVQVVIESARKEQVLDATMEGPILLAKLAPGRVHGHGRLRRSGAHPDGDRPGAGAGAGGLPLERGQVSDAT